MNKHSNKLNITDSKLFREVSGVIGKVAALEELTKAYREYAPASNSPRFSWKEELIDAFWWFGTPQGKEFWTEIYREAKNLEERCLEEKRRVI